MPNKVEMPISDLEHFTISKKLTMPLEEVKKRVAAGAKLELVTSTFKDPGPDYSKVLLDGEEIAHVDGY